MRPHFVGIGPPRTGSTTLWACLRMHPDIEMPEAKELHWFDRADWDPSTQQKHYERNWLTSDKVRGEITTNYCLHLDRILDLYPNIRLIMTTRDPVERFLSAMVLSYKRNGAKSSWEEYQQLVEDHLLEHRYHEDTDYQLRLGEYSKLTAEVSPAQLLVIDIDDLSKHQTDVMVNVANFLGVRPFRNIPYRHENTIPWRFPFSDESLTALKNYYVSK